MAFKKIKIETIISADQKRVWEAWTTSTHIVHWNFASDDWICPSAEVDLRVGGRYKARMEAKDKSFGFDFEATYQEVEPYKRVTLLLDDGRLARTDFIKRGDFTYVTTEFDAETTNSEQMQKDGWQAILNNFKKYVENTIKT